MTDEEKEQIIMKEIDEMYRNHWKEMDKIIENNPNITEKECNDFDLTFYKTISPYIKKRKKELNIVSTQK